MKKIIYFYDSSVVSFREVLYDIETSLKKEKINYKYYTNNRTVRDIKQSVWEIKIKDINCPGDVVGICANAVFGVCIDRNLTIYNYIRCRYNVTYGYFIYDMINYIKNLEEEYIKSRKMLLNSIYGYGIWNTLTLVDECRSQPFFQPKIEKAIFNEPATIVIWDDGTKTIVKCCEDDVYSKETGLAMCICKKLFGNNNQFKKEFKKWIPEEEKSTKGISFEDAVNKLREASRKFGILLSQDSDDTKKIELKAGHKVLKEDNRNIIVESFHPDHKNPEIYTPLAKRCLNCKHVAFNKDLCKYQCYSIRRVSTDLPDEFVCKYYKSKGDKNE